MTEIDLEHLEHLALRVREHVLRMAGGGGCFLGASLSCADLIVFLYTRFLYVSRDLACNPDRDYLLLSKGHDVPALYGTLAELGFIEPERLANHLKPHDSLYWHPNRAIPGVEFHSGSLGHLLAVGAGIAYDIRLRRGRNRVVVVVGDGELDEGSVWESLLVASAARLDNLIVVVDRNGFQANVQTEALVPLEPLAEKFEAFGCAVAKVDGHDFAMLERVFEEIPRRQGRPSVIIARTVRGKGLPSIEARADRWFCKFSAAEIERLLDELHGRRLAELASEALVVR
jgi:transketolase